MGTLKSEWWNALEGFETEEDVFEFIWERVNTKDFQDSRSCVMNIPEPSGYIKYSADDKRQSLYEFMMSIIEEKDTLLQKLTERDTEAERRRTEGNPQPLTLDELREMVDYTHGNSDNIEAAIKGLDLFTKNWCMNCSETEATNDLVFRCNECIFLVDGGNCLLKKMKYEHLPSYKNFVCMGDL